MSRRILPVALAAALTLALAACGGSQDDAGSDGATGAAILLAARPALAQAAAAVAGAERLLVVGSGADEAKLRFVQGDLHELAQLLGC